MRVLLDECIPRRFKQSLPDHECHTVPEAGWSGKTNGELLSLAERTGFDVFLTMDRGLAYEQQLAGRRIAVIFLQAKSNRLADLVPLAPACLLLLGSILPSQLIHVGL
jgi:hypothetical protein